jgi:2-isopropylmalate synthase
MVLGKHSGRHAFEERLKELHLSLTDAQQSSVFAQFKLLADKKKVVSDRDIEALVMDAAPSIPETWTLDHWLINSVAGLSSTATIRLKHKDGTLHENAAVGDGPLDAAFKAIDLITGKEVGLELYELGAITGGKSAQGETMVKITKNGRHWNGRGVSTDIVQSSVKAYVSAINALEWETAAR